MDYNKAIKNRETQTRFANKEKEIITMRINFAAGTIERNTTAAKAAGKPHTEKYNELVALRAQFPTYPVQIVKSASKRTTHLKGLTDDYMEKYIQSHDEDGTIHKEYYEMRGLDENGKQQEVAAYASYGEIKMWFLAKYPVFEDTEDKIREKMAEVKKVRAERKSARVR